MASKSNPAQIKELLLQALETERGGIQVYERAVQAAVNPDLKQEWEEYLEQTRHHEQVLLGVFEAFGLDPEQPSPGRAVVAHLGQGLVQAIEMAMADAPPEAAELVAAECVVLAETKDHQNWELIGHAAKRLSGDQARALREAHAEVETQEDHHLYHTRGWGRELWMQALGFPAVLPPPEEVKQVETAIGAARAEQTRNKML